MTPKEPDMRELDSVVDCPACGTRCKRIATCTCGESGCDGSSKLVPLCEPMTVEEMVKIMEQKASEDYTQKCGYPTKFFHFARAIHQAHMRRKT